MSVVVETLGTVDERPPVERKIILGKLLAGVAFGLSDSLQNLV